MKSIWSGLESSGKSLKLAIVVQNIVWRNHKWNKKRECIYAKRSQALDFDPILEPQPLARPIWSNLQFSKTFEERCERLGVPIHYWENLDDIIKIKDADVFIDEVGNYFDSRLWSELSLDARRWLSQGAKVGIELYGTAQDFAQVDKAFRRLVNNLVHVTKLVGSRRPSATKPPVGFIWGWVMCRDLDPAGYDEDDKKLAKMGFIPSFFFIRRSDCDIFDTGQLIKRSRPMPYKHVARDCELLPSCSFHKVSHV